MPEQRRDTGHQPAGYELGFETHWCHSCGVDRTVQIVQLAEDPLPVALCAECGVGLAIWLPGEPLTATRGAA